MQSLLFGRSYVLTIGAPTQAVPARYEGGTTNRSLRVTFDIKKTSTPDPNGAEIVIYNLNPANRSAITAGHKVTLSAGYKGHVGVIFFGIVTKVEAHQEQSDVAVKMTCADGGSAIAKAVYDMSYIKGISVKKVVVDLQDAMAQPTDANPIGIFPGDLSAIPEKYFDRGTQVHGPCSASLTSILTPLGVDWYVDNNTMFFVKKDGARTETAVDLRSGTGLIDIPSKSTDKLVVMKSLLNPRIVPGCRVKLTSSTKLFNGLYKVLSANFKGDTHGDDWSVSAECIQSPKVGST